MVSQLLRSFVTQKPEDSGFSRRGFPVLGYLAVSTFPIALSRPHRGGGSTPEDKGSWIQGPCRDSRHTAGVAGDMARVYGAAIVHLTLTSSRLLSLNDVARAALCLATSSSGRCTLKEQVLFGA